MTTLLPRLHNTTLFSIACVCSETSEAGEDQQISTLLATPPPHHGVCCFLLFFLPA